MKTTSRPATRRIEAVGLALAPLLCVATASTSGCGQVTGLSDDYTFDLDDAAGASTDAGDAGRDAAPSTEAGTSVDAGACQSTAATTLNNQGGTLQCRTCLATGCCNQIAACWNDSNCRNTLRCVLACSAENAPTSCVAKCGGVNAGMFSAMKSCAQQSCTSTCF